MTLASLPPHSDQSSEELAPSRKDLHPLHQSVVPILIVRDGVLEIAGTAFFIGLAWFMTASHTLLHEGLPRAEEAYVLLPRERTGPDTFRVEPLAVRRLDTSTYPTTDLAVLNTGMPTRNGRLILPSRLPISFRPPEIGTPCWIIGYTAGLTIGEMDKGKLRVTVMPTLHASMGVVQEVSHVARDSKLVTFPHLRTSAHVPSQMSGSPVVTGDGDDRRVVGVAATGYDLVPDAVPLSYTSLMWPAAGLGVTIDTPQGGEVRRPLLDLAREGLLDADDSLDAVTVVERAPNVWTVGPGT
jgi:hypothetical protein